MANPVDIRPDHLQIVQDILQEHLPAGVKVRVFGSRAKWSTRDASDLDLALEGETKLERSLLVSLADAFENSDLPYRVDVVDLNRASELFRRIIESSGEQLALRYGKTGTQGERRKVALGDCIVVNDATYSPKEAWPVINYLDTGNITANRISSIQNLVVGKDKIPSRARRKVTSGDIVYSTVRPSQRHFGLIKRTPENFLASTGFAVIRAREGIADTDFIYWFLAQDHIVDYLHSIAEQNTSAYPSINPSDIEQVELTLPPIAEQRAIAHILGALDDKIELNRRMNETLEEMAHAIFRDWFVEFGPVRAKLEGREPYLPPELWNLFPNRLADSELGEIPDGWEVGEIGDVATQRRQAVKPKDIDPETPYISLEHMPRKCIALSEWDHAAGLASGKFRFQKSDILFGKLRPYFHKVGVAPLDGVCSTDIVVVTPKSSDWFGFALGHLSSAEFVDYTDATSAGTRMPRTNWADMASYEIPLPSRELAGACTSLVQPWVDKMVSAIHESRAIAAQRDALLPRLVSGELEIEEPRDSLE